MQDQDRREWKLKDFRFLRRLGLDEQSEKMEQLIGEGLVSDTDIEGFLPIEVVIEGGHITIFDQLFEKGFYTNLTLEQKKKVLSTAIVSHIAQPTGMLEKIMEEITPGEILEVAFSEKLNRSIRNISCSGYSKKVKTTYSVILDHVTKNIQSGKEGMLVRSPSLVATWYYSLVFLDSSQEELNDLSTKILGLAKLVIPGADYISSVFNLYTDTSLVNRLCRWHKLDLYNDLKGRISPENFPIERIREHWNQADDSALGKEEMLKLLSQEGP